MNSDSKNLPGKLPVRPSDEDLKVLAFIAKNLVFEPYEGMKAIEQIQNTQQKLNKKYVAVKDKLSHFSKKGTEFSKEKLKKVKKYSEKKFPENDFSWEKYIPEPVQNKVKKIFDGTFQTAKSSSEKILQLTRMKSVEYIEQSFKILMSHNGEEWIVGSAREILVRDDLFGFEDIRNLSDKERKILLSKLYPYSDKALQKYSEKFEYGVNLLMGAIVATNLPFTGLMVCFINIARTIVRSANKIMTLSNIYGRPIESKAALFCLIAKILHSFHDDDTSEFHQPLSPEVLETLYRHEDSKEDFESLLKQIALRDHYIVIPIVGMISFTKLNLDDLKIDIYMESLFAGYFHWQAQKQKHLPEVLEPTVDSLKNIFFDLKTENFLSRQKTISVRKEKKRGKGFFSLPQSQKDELVKLHQGMIDHALEIYQSSVQENS